MSIALKMNTISIRQIIVVTERLNFSQHTSSSLTKNQKMDICFHPVKSPFHTSKVGHKPFRTIRVVSPFDLSKQGSRSMIYIGCSYTPIFQKSAGKFKNNRQEIFKIDHTHYSYLIVTGQTVAYLRPKSAVICQKYIHSSTTSQQKNSTNQNKVR